MKKIFIVTLAIISSLLGVNCTKLLEEKPVGLLAPEGFFKTKKDVESAIFGAYGRVASEPLFGRQFTCALMFRSDMVDIGNRGTGVERIQVNDFNMDASNGMVATFWPVWYQVVSAANSAEDGAKKIGLSEAETNPLIAEAKFVRAFAYYHLVRNFGDIPYIDQFISDPAILKTISKTKEADVYTKIIADLQFAKQWLPDRQPNDVRTRPTKATAAAYLASVYLTNANYQGAYTEAKWVIDNRSAYNYILEPDFQNLFRANQGNNMKEHIFAVDFMGQLSRGSENDDLLGPMVGIRGSNIPENGFGVCVPALRVFTTWDANDYRRKVSFNDSITTTSGVKISYTAYPNEKRPHIAKWIRFPGNSIANGRYSDFNYPDMRYAEILLIAAEAATEVNGATQEAIDYINEVRTRARNWPGRVTTAPANLMLSNFTSKQQLIDAIIDERRLELAFEFKRWYDIKRRRLGDEVFKGPNALEPRPNFSSDRDYLMPIPLTEIQINPNLKPQNPNY
ncbi:SusD family protein [Pedobacter glucosidilyticus]|nr:RagB/SusD family nutrient uptake outer membrane protein [Pedobacter glucosidilyticus]KHJ38736.1 SusD family protein [Pedobacter glucosidilyticus]